MRSLHFHAGRALYGCTAWWRSGTRTCSRQTRNASSSPPSPARATGTEVASCARHAPKPSGSSWPMRGRQWRTRCEACCRCLPSRLRSLNWAGLPASSDCCRTPGPDSATRRRQRLPSPCFACWATAVQARTRPPWRRRRHSSSDVRLPHRCTRPLLSTRAFAAPSRMNGQRGVLRRCYFNRSRLISSHRHWPKPGGLCQPYRCCATTSTALCGKLPLSPPPPFLGSRAAVGICPPEQTSPANAPPRCTCVSGYARIALRRANGWVPRASTATRCQSFRQRVARPPRPLRRASAPRPQPSPEERRAQQTRLGGRARRVRQASPPWREGTTAATVVGKRQARATGWWSLCHLGRQKVTSWTPFKAWRKLLLTSRMGRRSRERRDMVAPREGATLDGTAHLWPRF
mmetsp:Transcript_41471/g.137419  ORF Transcript_41471/g.137419 Transcript_41471/m.137419 type:complete len:403 (-) Transcript_41471:2299-3507(-)